MNLGISFPDFIGKTKYKPSAARLRQNREEFYNSSMSFLSGSTLAWLVLFVSFFVLVFQSLRVQLFQGPYYRELSEQNRVRTKFIRAPRGTIYDRNGAPLVINIPGYLEKLPDCTNQKSCFRVLSRDEVLDKKAKGENIDNLEIDSLRSYVAPGAFAHVLGYTTEVTQEEIDEQKNVSDPYTPGDRIGRGGVEEQYETILRGTKGKELVEVDAMGEALRILGKEDAKPGQDITLSLDKKLQEVAYEAIKDKTGAVIVSNPKTGEILALVSSPSYDSNLFTLGEHYASSSASIQEILSDGIRMPLFDRAISGVYPPGSTFKIVVASAALESGAINEDTQVEDTGVVHLGAFSFSNWYFTEYGGKDGLVNIVKAIKRSNDIFFYKTAEATGLDKLREMGLKFGLSSKLGIDVPNEVSGLFPSDDWKRKTLGEQWYSGDTYHLGIGQGFLLTTPLQVNAWTSVIANGGTLYEPHLLKSQKSTPIKSESKVKSQNFLSEKTIDLIHEGMKEACDTGGTGWPLFQFKVKNENIKIDSENFFEVPQATISSSFKDYRKIPIACKTGTAETGNVNDKPHAWFTSYAPIADPQIVVTVLVEKGGQGSDVAAPIAKKIYEEWFGR